MKRTWKQNWRSVISMVVGLALLLGGLPVFRAEATPATFDWTLAPGQVKANKTVTAVAGQPDTFDVTLEAAGKKPDPKGEINNLDVVLIIDSSASMVQGEGTNPPARDRLAKAKVAAKAMAQDLLRADAKGENRIAVFSFNLRTEVETAFTRDLDEAKSAIGKIEPEYWTNIQNALVKAETFLNDSSNQDDRDAVPVVVLLSDGAPSAYYHGLLTNPVEGKAATGKPTSFTPNSEWNWYEWIENWGGKDEKWEEVSKDGEKKTAEERAAYWTIRQAARLKASVPNLKIYTIGLGIEESKAAKITLNPGGDETGTYHFEHLNKSKQYVGQQDNQGYSSSWPISNDNRYQYFLSTQATALKPNDGWQVGGLDPNPRGPLENFDGYEYNDKYYNSPSTDDLAQIFKDIVGEITQPEALASSVVITDEIGDGFELAENILQRTDGTTVNGGNKGNNGTVTWTIPKENLPMQEHDADVAATPVSLTFKVRLKDGLDGSVGEGEDGKKIFNTNKSAKYEFKPASNNTHYDTEEKITQSLDGNASVTLGIGLTKTASAKSVTAGTPVTYTLTATNYSSIPLKSITFTDDMLNGATINGERHNSNTLTLDQPLAAGAEAVVTYKAIPAFLEGKHKNTATVSGSYGKDIITANAEATVSETVLNAAIGITKTATPEVPSGSTGDVPNVQFNGWVTYKLNITNNGAVPLNNISVKDDMFKWVDEWKSGGTYNKQTNRLEIPNALEVDRSTEVVYRVLFDSAGSTGLRPNTATVYASAGEGSTVENTATASVYVLTPPKLSVEKSVALWDGTLDVPSDAAFVKALRIKNPIIAPEVPADLALMRGAAVTVNPAEELARLDAVVKQAADQVEALEQSLAEKQAELQRLEASDLTLLNQRVRDAQGVLQAAETDYESAKSDLDALRNPSPLPEPVEPVVDNGGAAIAVASVGGVNEDEEDDDPLGVDNINNGDGTGDADGDDGSTDDESMRQAEAAYEAAVKAVLDAEKALADAELALEGAQDNDDAINRLMDEIGDENNGLIKELADAKQALSDAIEDLEAYITNNNLGDIDNANNSVIFKVVLYNHGQTTGIIFWTDVINDVEMDWYILWDGKLEPITLFENAWQNSSIYGGQAYTLYAVAKDLQPNTTYVNRLAMFLDEGLSNLLDQDTATVIVGNEPAPAFSVVKTAREHSVWEGDKATFDITVTNSGDAAGTFTLVDTFDGNIVTIEGDTGDVNLSPGESKKFVYETSGLIVTGDNGYQDYTNIVKVLSNGSEVGTSQDTVRVYKRIADLRITKDVWDGATASWADNTSMQLSNGMASAKFRIVVENKGMKNEEFVLADVLNSLGIKLPEVGGAVSYQFADLTQDAIETGYMLPKLTGKLNFEVTVTFAVPGTYRNTVSILQGENTAGSATATVNVEAEPVIPPPTTPPTTTPTEPTPPAIIPYTPSPSPTPGPSLPPEEVIEDEDVPLGQLPTESPAPAQADETIEEAAIPFAHPKTGERTSGVSVWMLAGAVVMFAVSAVLWHLDSKRAGKRK